MVGRQVLVLEIGVVSQVEVWHTGLHLFGLDLIKQLYIGPAWIPYPTLGNLSPVHHPEGGHGTQDLDFEMGLRREVFHDPGNLHLNLLFHQESFSNGRFVAKIFFCRALC